MDALRYCLPPTVFSAATQCLACQRCSLLGAGSIPASWGGKDALAALELIQLSGNKLCGDVPAPLQPKLVSGRAGQWAGQFWEALATIGEPPYVRFPTAMTQGWHSAGPTNPPLLLLSCRSVRMATTAAPMASCLPAPPQ